MSSVKDEIIFSSFQKLFREKSGESVETISEVKPGASLRKIFRLSSGEFSAIGIFNDNTAENDAFISFTSAFRDNGFNAPEIYLISDDRKIYLEEDLGDITLNNLINSEPDRLKVVSHCKQALTELFSIQTVLKDKIDYSKCYQTNKFDNFVVRNDLEKFQTYYALKSDLKNFNMNEILNNYSKLLEWMNTDYFLYRDFQSRNIMIKNDEMFYIDYQSGRKGPAYYDAASFIFSGSVEFSDEEKLEMIDHYSKLVFPNEPSELFQKFFYEMAYLRTLQILGSYAYSFFNHTAEWVLPKFNPAKENLKFIIERLNNDLLIREGEKIVDSVIYL